VKRVRNDGRGHGQPCHFPRASLDLRSERGVALLIVVSVLTVIGIMGVAFAYSMYLETNATRQFVSTAQARYLAEAGVNHARALLDEDRLGSRTDDLSEHWVKDPAGHDVDVDGSGAPDARWWGVADADQRPVGHYAFHVSDEAGKANLNAAQADPPSSGVGAINLTKILEAAGLSDAHNVAKTIEQYRYGPDGKPGVAGIDDDGNGAIDDPAEYQPLALVGDDRRLEQLEDLVAVAGLKAEDARRLSRFATVYSWDLNVSVTGKPRLNVNTASANELLGVLLDAGVQNPWQAAANMADYVDADLELSQVTKASQVLTIPNQGAVGGWTWKQDTGGYYTTDGSTTGTLSWTVTVPAGHVRVLARGMSGMKIGDVTIAGQLHASVDDGESLGFFDLNTTLTIGVTNHEPAGTACAFRGIELVSEGTDSGVRVRGIEAIRFNEVMVEPTIMFDVATATFDPQGSGWNCPMGGGACTNGGVGQGRWMWSSALLQSGRYYLRVFGAAAGQTVGEVRVDGDSKLLIHGQRHPSTVSVGSDGKITVTIGKTKSEETYFLKGVSLSLQPDAEYVEFINLSERDIDMSGWTIEGELTGGRQAKLPVKSVIKAHGLLVAVVDLDDQQAGLEGNGISARLAWQVAKDVNAVQLEFPNGAPSPDDDWLKVTVPGGSVPRLLLRTKEGHTVDEVQYPLPPKNTAPFQSLEKGDPAVMVDQNGDGIDDGWYPSLKLYTPGIANDNEDLKELVGLQTVVHDPSKEITMLNRSLTSVGELAGVPSGIAWKPFSSADLAKIVDRLTVEGHRLEVAGHWVEAGGSGAWEEKAEGYYVHTDPQKADVPGRWQWANLSDGIYRLSLYGCAGCSGEQVAVRWQQKDLTFTDWSPSLITDAQGRITVGQITIGVDSTPPNTLTLELLCKSASGICHVASARLDPQLIRIGPVNLNTAPREVLLALPGVTETIASRILAGRPYGDKEGKGRGLGDLLIDDTLGVDEESKLGVFRQCAHLLTTRTDVFEIVSLGQSQSGKRDTAIQKIRAVIQR